MHQKRTRNYLNYYDYNKLFLLSSMSWSFCSVLHGASEEIVYNEKFFKIIPLFLQDKQRSSACHRALRPEPSRALQSVQNRDTPCLRVFCMPFLLPPRVSSSSLAPILLLLPLHHTTIPLSNAFIHSLDTFCSSSFY